MIVLVGMGLRHGVERLRTSVMDGFLQYLGGSVLGLILCACAGSVTWAEALVLDSRPRLLTEIEPRYPQDLRDLGVEGRVVYSFVVAADGGIQDPKLVESAHSRLSELAWEAIALAKFEPGRADGEPVAVRVTQGVSFKLDSISDDRDWIDMTDARKLGLSSARKRHKNKGIKDLKRFEQESKIWLEEELKLKGIDRKLFSTSEIRGVLPKGAHSAVMESRYGIFYLAEGRGFYFQDGNRDWYVGGVCLPHDGSEAMFWYIEHADEDGLRSMLRGSGIEGNFRKRMELDFQLPVLVGELFVPGGRFQERDNVRH